MKKLIGVALMTATVAWLAATGVHGQADKKKPAKEVKRQSDADMSKLFAGKWLMENKEGKGASVKVVLVNKKDGTFTAEIKVEIEFGEKKITDEVKVTGTWKIEGGILEQTMKSSTSPKTVKVGDVNRDEMVFIDEKVFKTRGLKGKDKDKKEEVWKRVKE